MALPEALTAAEIAEFLRMNYPQDSKLEIGSAIFESAANSWTARERRDVVAAAKHNTSIRYLSIDVDGLTTKSAKLMSSIVAHLGHVRKLKVYDSFESDDRPSVATVDGVVAAVVKSRSNIVSLKFSPCLSASALYKVTQRYLELEELQFSEEFGDDDAYDDDELVGTDRDALAIAVGVAMGRLPSLRRVALQFHSTHARVFGMLSALHTAPTIRAVEIGFPVDDDSEGGADEVVLQAAFVCACTRTIESVIFRGNDTEVSVLFGMDPVPAFSPSIKEVQFHGCYVEDPEESLVRRAAKSLENVESFSLSMSPGSFARQVVERMPRLKKFSFVSRDDNVNDWEDADDYIEENDQYSFVETNTELSALCRVLNRKRSLLEDLEIELQGSADEAFPAMTRLIRNRKGRLILKLACLPWEALVHIVRGLERLHPDLRELRLRFRFCHFNHQDYSDIYFALRSNETLRAFECDFAGEADDLIIFAIQHLVSVNATLQTLSFRELDAGTGAAILAAIAPVLRWRNHTLRFLGLHGADLDDDWPHLEGPMLEMLQENYVLSGLEGVELAEDDPVALLLKQNRYGRRFLDANDNSPIGIWTAVLANISQNEEHRVMYKFLRAKPDLVVRTTARPVTARGRRVRKRGRAGN